MNRVPNRGSQLDEIRRTYKSYTLAGRERLWVTSNRGFARIVHDRDQALGDLLRRSLPTAARPSVLDLGCGAGNSARLALGLELTVDWVGVDLLPDRLDVARETHPWARFVEASADELPFDSGTFNVVLASTLFSSLPTLDFERAVANEVSRVLRPGGWLIWYDLRRGNPRNPAVHGLPQARVRELFPGWRGEFHTLTLLPPVARRLGGFTPLLYPALAALPLLRSHLVGRLERPGHEE